MIPIIVKVEVWVINIVLFLKIIPLKPNLQLFYYIFTDDKQHKARELDMITLTNHALRSYMTWLSVTLSVFDMIIV